MHREALSDEELAILRTPQHDVVSASPPQDDISEHDTPHVSLAELHREFAATMAASLSTLIRREVSVRLRDQSTGIYSQFVFGQSIPTCCAIVRAESIDLEFYIAIQPTILYPLIDRLLGCKESEPTPGRPITEIETGVALIMINDIVAKYGSAWQQALAMELVVNQIEHNLQQFHAIPGREETFHARYDVRCGPSHGLVEFCLPWQATHQIRQRLAASR